MLSLGIIEASQSEWCNPIVRVPRKDGTIRFCIDFHHYPTPCIDNLIDHLARPSTYPLATLKNTWNISGLLLSVFTLQVLPSTQPSVPLSEGRQSVLTISSAMESSGLRSRKSYPGPIQFCPLPQSRTQLKSFIGMSGWYHRFIPNYSVRAAQLTDMTTTKWPNQLSWKEEAKNTFTDIQWALSKDTLRHCPDFEEQFILQTNASNRGLVAVLLQGPLEHRRPIVFISRKLYPREPRYSTVEKAFMAVKWALDSLKYYLLGWVFVLKTDHKALKWLRRMKDTNSRMVSGPLHLSQEECYSWLPFLLSQRDSRGGGVRGSCTITISCTSVSISSFTF